MYFSKWSLEPPAPSGPKQTNIMLYYISLLGGGEGTLALCLDCRESSYFHTAMLCVFSNIIGGFILLHFNCDSEVPAEGTGYTS